MSYEKVGRLALLLGILCAGTVLALWSTWDAAAIVGFLGGLTGVGVALLAQLKATREVHVMINQQRTDAAKFTVLLEKTIRDAGMVVPADRSLE